MQSKLNRVILLKINHFFFAITYLREFSLPLNWWIFFSFLSNYIESVWFSRESWAEFIWNFQNRHKYIDNEMHIYIETHTYTRRYKEKQNKIKMQLYLFIKDKYPLRYIMRMLVSNRNAIVFVRIMFIEMSITIQWQHTVWHVCICMYKKQPNVYMFMYCNTLYELISFVYIFGVTLKASVSIVQNYWCIVTLLLIILSFDWIFISIK